MEPNPTAPGQPPTRPGADPDATDPVARDLTAGDPATPDAAGDPVITDVAAAAITPDPAPANATAPDQPPIRPGPEPGEPRRAMVPGRAVLPPPLRRRVTAFDAAVDRAFDLVRGKPVADRLFYAASEIGDFSVLWHIVGCARGLRSDHDFWAAVRLSSALGAESVLVNVGIKSLFNRARPVWEQPRPHRLRRPLSSSFPSGHASSAFTAAGLLAEGSRAWPAWYLLAAFVAASRVHVKIHHASDVVGGALIGVALGHVGRKAWPLRNR